MKTPLRFLTQVPLLVHTAIVALITTITTLAPSTVLALCLGSGDPFCTDILVGTTGKGWSCTWTSDSAGTVLGGICIHRDLEDCTNATGLVTKFIDNSKITVDITLSCPGALDLVVTDGHVLHGQIVSGRITVNKNIFGSIYVGGLRN